MTRHQMEWSWKKLFPTVFPVPVALNPNAQGIPRWDPQEDEIVDEPAFAYGYYVPFKESVAQFLSIDSVYNAIMENFAKNSYPIPTDRSFSDVWECDFVQNNPIFVENQGQVLGFQIYYDDVEPANPLGSKKGCHKQAVFYWTLLNLPPQFRSALRSIQIIAIVKTSYLREHGPRALLKPFLDTMVEFQTGVELNIRGELKTFRGILINVVGDMLGSSFLGGFKEGVGRAFRPCRICYIKRDELDITHHQSNCTLRDKDSYANHLSEIMDVSINIQTKKELSKEHGIVRDCCLSMLPYFDPTKQFPHDLMHVLYEGILNLECRLLLQKLLEEGIIDIDVINQKIKSFKSFREFTTPPPLIKKQILDETPLSYSSSEMQALITILPLILAEYCSCENDPHYANFVLLIQIAASLQCYSFGESDLDLLAYLIHLHNSAFVLLYPATLNNPSITPKLHALIHLVYQIRLFGAPRFAWAFSYESKNAHLKRVMRNISNFKNVSFSVAQSFQRLAALLVESNRDSNYFGNFSDLKIVKLLPGIQAIGSRPWFSNIPMNPPIRDCSATTGVKIIESCTISGRLCKTGTVFCKHLPSKDALHSSHSLPSFWRIADMFIYEDNNILVLENLSTSHFDLDRFSFLATPTHTFCALLCSSLVYNAPLHSFVNCESVYIVPNYYHLC